MNILITWIFINKLRHTLFYIALFLSPALYGQTFYDDTIRINEVVISSRKNAPVNPGFKEHSVDTSVMKIYDLKSISELISENTPVFIKTYGSGGSATPSFRGTAAGNTKITWNGINIENPMPGQSDLSLLPAGMIDDLHIYFGGASMAAGSGAAGGVISLETAPEFDRRYSASLSTGAGSFGNYSGFLTLKSGSESFQSVTKALYQFAENNFRYINAVSSSIPFTDTRKNNEVAQRGFMQELYYRKYDNDFSARFWYQSAERNLPSSLLTAQPGLHEKQYDESFRSMLSYDMRKSSHNYSIDAAWVINRLNYMNNLASIDSRNFSGMWVLKASTERSFGKASLRFALDEEFNSIKSNNYEGNVSRNSAGLSFSARSLSMGRLNGSFLLREILHRDKFLVPDFSTGLQLKMSEVKEYYIKANFSRSSRIPAMNDLYWKPGGNTHLKNEYSYICEVNYEMEDHFLVFDLDYDLSFFRNSVKDMIQWHPGEFSYWTADNIRNVISKGVESSLSLKYRNNKLSSSLTTNYSFTKANETDKESAVNYQLIYIPEHQFNLSLNAWYGISYATWRSIITGRRFTEADNSNYLPAFCVNSIITGLKKEINKCVFDLRFDVENIFNVAYETIAWYPLPGRNYNIRLSIQFTNHLK